MTIVASTHPQTLGTWLIPGRAGFVGVKVGHTFYPQVVRLAREATYAEWEADPTNELKGAQAAHVAARDGLKYFYEIESD